MVSANCTVAALILWSGHISATTGDFLVSDRKNLVR